MLLDTSGIFCYYHPGEPQHNEAKPLFESRRQKLTHNYVLSEFVALVHARRIARLPALGFAQRIFEIPDIEVGWVDEELHREAMELLLARPDKGYSLCDAVSFILMRRYELVDALTTDHHFEQEGFRRLLLP